MAGPYDFPSSGPDKPPAVSIMTLIGVIFVAFMMWQIGSTIAAGPEPVGARVVDQGDTITYDYVARGPDGTLFATTVQSVAATANTATGFPLQEAIAYQPEQVTIGSDTSRFGAIVEEALLGARPGQTITVTVPAELGSGAWTSITPDRPGIDRVIGRQPYQFERFFQEPDAAAAEGNEGSFGFDMDALFQQLGDIESGYVYNDGTVFPPALDLVFVDVNRDNRSITVQYPAEHNKYYDIEKLPGGLTLLVEDGTMAWRFEVEQDATFIVEDGDALNQVGLNPGSYKIGDVTDTHVELLHNPAFAPHLVGQPLAVEVTVRDIVAKAGQAVPNEGPSFAQPIGVGPAGAGHAGDGHAGHQH